MTEIRKIGPHIQYIYPCDDRSGFNLVVTNSCDGDVWIKIVPNKDCKNLELYKGCFGAGVRIRVPGIGGGSHKNLWDGIAQALRKEDDEARFV